jgi:DnaJ-class molecular chaperone
MTLYDDLGVNKGASASEIKKAFREKAKENHEDLGGEKEVMTKLNHAYGVLSNPVKRKRYDDTGEEKELGFEVKFGGLVQQVFMGLVEREEKIDNVDLVGRFSDIVSGILAENNKNKSVVGRKIAKLAKVLGRLSEGQIKRIVENNLEDLKREMELVKENIEFIKKAKEVIDSQHYNFDLADDDGAVLPTWFRQHA